MYIEVIPQSHSISTHPLTYSVGDVLSSDIHIGSLVAIPHGKQDILGFVSAIDVPPIVGADIREIHENKSGRPLLAPYQIQVIQKLANKYKLPIHRVLQWFFPRPIEARIEKRGFDTLPISLVGSLIDPPDPNRLILLRDTIIYPNILQHFLREKQVIIAPDDFTLFAYESEFSSPDTLFLPNESTDTKRAQAWIDIVNGKYTRIFGTRRILYYNLHAYDHILYIEDAFQGEYFHFPTRIQYLDILAFFDQAHQFHLDILSSSPLLKTMSMFRHFDVEYSTFE